MSGRRVLVTGAGRGIGAATAAALAEPGGTVVVNYRSDDDAAAAACARVSAAGARAVSVKADVTDPGQVDALFERAAREAGGLDVLVLNAGVPYRYERLARLSPEEFEAQWRVLTFSAFLCLRRALPLFPKGGGDAVFVLSAAVTGDPPGFMGGYVSAKYALLGLARALAAESGAKGPRVHCISPQMTDTAFIKGFPRPIVDAARETQGGSLLSPDEVAAEVLGAVKAP
ncbi:MAG: SDR family oxidoreductase [Elusimicrobia bacterium]|nr:SDR family oxidoreductase [Elusimicrobiota bacterium]